MKSTFMRFCPWLHYNQDSLLYVADPAPNPDSLCPPIPELGGLRIPEGSQAFFYDQDSDQCRVFFCQVCGGTEGVEKVAERERGFIRKK